MSIIKQHNNNIINVSGMFSSFPFPCLQNNAMIYYSVVSAGIIAYFSTASHLSATSAQLGSKSLEVDVSGGRPLPSIGIDNCLDATTIDVGEQFQDCWLKASNNINSNDPSSGEMNITDDMAGDFNEVLLSPSLTSVEDFVTKLEDYTRDHQAVSHPFLPSLAGASFGNSKHEAADMLLLFLSAYLGFNSGFIGNIETLLSLLDDEDHIRNLKENLQEEMGVYDEETLLEMETFGISRKSVEFVTHRDLFIDLVRFLETTLNNSYSNKMSALKHIPEPMNQAIDFAREQGQLGLLAALYFGSELIVPTIYSSILQGLKNSIDDVSNENVKFLLIHIDMDKSHALTLREIILQNCKTKADRLILLACTKRLLDARVDFYNLLIGYSSRDIANRD